MVSPRHDIELQSDLPPRGRRRPEYDSLTLRELFTRVRSGALPEGVVHRLMSGYVRTIVPPRPSSEPRPDGEYEDQYKCCPPPIALIILSIIEIIVFIVDVSATGSTYSVSGPVASACIYDPHRRYEAWRFLSYSLVHIGEMHIIMNLAVLLLLGIPLEMVHGWWRVLSVYFSGVVLGSLLTSISDPTVYLAGASGGVYSILTAHIATIIMNWSDMALPWLQLGVFMLLITADLGTAIYQRYVAKLDLQVGYVAHLGGALAGLLVGIYILRNLNLKKWERWLWWAALIAYILLMGVCIVWNIAFPDYFPPPHYN
ncbi:hypothetical protein B566_EDAN006112 [Ephemera danica]|nr:hypothetical protein B566_EDAN006112 [Ephemera danica]